MLYGEEKDNVEVKFLVFRLYNKWFYFFFISLIIFKVKILGVI